MEDVGQVKEAVFSIMQETRRVAGGEEAVSRRVGVDNEYFLVVFLYPFLLVYGPGRMELFD